MSKQTSSMFYDLCPFVKQTVYSRDMQNRCQSVVSTVNKFTPEQNAVLVISGKQIFHMNINNFR
jgi:hypothetical protein